MNKPWEVGRTLLVSANFFGGRNFVIIIVDRV